MESIEKFRGESLQAFQEDRIPLVVPGAVLRRRIPKENSDTVPGAAFLKLLVTSHWWVAKVRPIP